MKLRVNSNISLEDIIDKYLYPVKEYIKEKHDNNMYDDWNELEHTTKWLEKILNSINENNGDILDIYYIKNNDNIIGVIFALSGNDSMLKFLEENNINSKTNKIAQLSCFHIIKDHRRNRKKLVRKRGSKRFKRPRH